MSGRNHQGGGGGYWEQERHQFAQGGGPNFYQAEMLGMPYHEMRHCHNQHVGRINQEIYNQGLLAPVAFAAGYDSGAYAANYNGSQQAHYAAMRAEQQRQQYARHCQETGGYNNNQQYERAPYNQPPQGDYPQQNYYPQQNINPDQHRHPHCHCRHHGRPIHRNVGGQQYPPEGQQYPPEGQQYPPERQQYPPQGQDCPQGEPARQGQNGYQDTRYDRTYDGATYKAKDAGCNAKVVADVARQLGVDPVVAIAAMLVESGGNAQAVGDRGNSFGLFQLNKRGELKEANLTPEQAFDPVTNARVALSHFQKGHVSNPGVMVANAQRPADRADYARKLNARLAQAQQLLQQAEA